VLFLASFNKLNPVGLNQKTLPCIRGAVAIFILDGATESKPCTAVFIDLADRHLFSNASKNSVSLRLRKIRDEPIGNAQNSDDVADGKLVSSRVWHFQQRLEIGLPFAIGYSGVTYAAVIPPSTRKSVPVT
jgi:hypothetical protein